MVLDADHNVALLNRKGCEILEVSEAEAQARIGELEAAQLLEEDSQAGELIETDSDEGLGDANEGGAEVRDRYSASDEDPLVGGGEETTGEQTDRLA